MIAAAILGKFVVAMAAAFGSLRYGVGFYAWHVSEKLEKPTYTVIRQLSDGVELRRYEPYLIAETTVNGSGFREPTADGFRACAGYIFGKNKPKRGNGSAEKMSMTAPVRVSGQSERGGRAKNAPTKVSFLIGSKYTMKTAPTPLDRNVSLRKVPSHVLATRKFSGPPPSDNRVELERERLERALKEADIEPSDKEIFVMGYHDPFATPNFLRRNEVAVNVKDQFA